MNIDNPIFLLPKDQISQDYKPGGGSRPKFYGEKNNFETSKRTRITEIDQIIQSSRVDTKLKAPDDKVFFSLEFEKGATAKTSQPVGLLDKFNVDIETQRSETVFYATSSTDDLTKFRSAIGGMNIKKTRDDAALLSAIKKIDTISRRSKLDGVSDLPAGESIKGFVYLHPSLSDAEAKIVYENVEEIVSKTKGEGLEYFVSPSGSKIIYGSYSRDELGEIVDASPANPIMRFEKSHNFIVPSAAETYRSLDDVSVIKPELDATVVVMDTGMTAHELYKDLVLDQKDYISGRTEEETAHGTLVGTRAMFGDNIQDMLDAGGQLFAQTNVIDCRVISSQGASDRNIVAAVSKILDEYSGKVKTYNLSINNKDVFDASEQRSYFTREIDALAHKHNVLIVCSAGNSYDWVHDAQHPGLSYPDCVLGEGSIITPPADGINVISVGAIAGTDSTRSLARAQEPSPFTRHSPNELWKPDLVHYGGNIDRNGRAAGIGAEGFAPTQNSIAEDAGTSFAAPVVSQSVAKLFAYLESTGIWKERPVALTKALTLHSATYNLPQGSSIQDSDLRHLTGFGVPDYQRALDTSKNAATFITTGLIGEPMESKAGKEVKASKQKLQFTVPKELCGKNKKVRVRGTLVYLPPVSSSGGLDYADASIEFNLHYRNSRGTLQSGRLTGGGSDYRLKWNPVQSFDMTYHAFDGGMWEAWLTLTTRGASSNADFTQEYALVITVEDVSPDIDTRIALHELISTKYKQYVPLRARVQTTQPVKLKS